MSCYRFEELNFDNSLFESVDVTYIIHLENNGRLENVMDQLNKFKPSKKCIIVHNLGYKKCSKPHLPQQSSNFDLLDVNLEIMKDAKKRDLKNVMVLEDDFFFDNDVFNHSKHVDQFIWKKENIPIVYFPGNIPLIQCPIEPFHNRLFLFGVSHCVIYNKPLYLDVLSKNSIFENTINHMDCFYLQYKCYNYYKPICFQLFPETENQKEWFLSFLMVFLVKMILLDKQHQPGFTILYILSYILSFFLLLMLIYFLYSYILKPIMKTKFTKNIFTMHI
jgi:hypothetical protein